MNKRYERILKAQLRIAVAFVGTLLGLNAIAGGNPKGGQVTSTPAAMYQSYCSVCHGEQGNGQSRARASLNPPPSDFTSPVVRAILTRERMLVTVREGRPGTAMVGWKTQLSDAQIAAIVDYVRTKFMDANLKPAMTGATALTPGQQVPAPSNARVSSIPASVPLAGNPADGRRLYDQNCTACHGKLGDGNGPRAYFISPKPRSFISAESRAAFSRPVLIHSISQGKLGTEMPSWEKVLSAQEIANVAEYVYQRFITPDSKIGTRDSK